MGYFKREKFERRDSGKSGGRFKDSGRSSGGRFSGRRDFDQQDNLGRREYERPSRKEEHEVVCDKCGKKCIVPFKPISNKPVYCNDCFKKKDNFEPTREKSSGDLEEINRKLDKIMEALDIQ